MSELVSGSSEEREGLKVNDVGGTELSPQGRSGVPPTSFAPPQEPPEVPPEAQENTEAVVADSPPLVAAEPPPVGALPPEVQSSQGSEPEVQPEPGAEVDDEWQPPEDVLEMQDSDRRVLGDEDELDDEMAPEAYINPTTDIHIPRLGGRRRGPRQLVKPEPIGKQPFLTPEQRLVILDTWRRSGLPAGDFAEMVGLSKHTLYGWKKKFEQQGPAGLMDHPRGKKGSRLPDVTRRSIVMLKEDHPDWGCQRISDVLMRGPGLAASPTTVSKVLYDEGYELVDVPTKPHPDKVRRFERAGPNQLWQTDLFTFILKRQNRRVYLVAFMDDHSRYIVSYGLHASQSAALVMEVFRAGITSCGAPQEVLTDNGSQYVTWRGTSAFAKELQRRGIQHVVASPRRPQTLGKVERFWGTLWRECLQAAVFIDMADAQARIGHFIDYYNFRRPHQGLEGLVPADRFFQLAPEVRKTMEARVSANALDLARNGLPKAPFYMTGQAGGKTFSVHAEGERVILSREGQVRQEIDLVAPTAPPQSMPAPACSQGVVASDGIGDEQPLGPGISMLDEGMHRIIQSMAPANGALEGGQQ